MGEFPSREHQFKPGNPGGPGRPRVKTILEVMRDRLEQDTGLGDGRTWAEEVTDQWLEMIADGDTGALKELLNRMYGKSPLKIEAEVTTTHIDGDLPAILAAFGYVAARPEAGPGEIQSGRPGGSCLEGEVDPGAAPGGPGREAEGVRAADPGGAESPAHDLDASQARQV